METKVREKHTNWHRTTFHPAFRPGEWCYLSSNSCGYLTNKATDEMKNAHSGRATRLAQGKFALSIRFDAEVQEWAKKPSTNVHAKFLSPFFDYSSFRQAPSIGFQQVIRSFAREIGDKGGYNLELITKHTAAIGRQSFSRSVEGRKPTTA